MHRYFRLSLTLLFFEALAGVFLFGAWQAPSVAAQSKNSGEAFVDRVSAASQESDLRSLPHIPNRLRSRGPLPRHPLSSTPADLTLTSGPLGPLLPAAVPAPDISFSGVNSGNSGCGGCLPPDTDGDVGPNHYIQAVNSSIQVFSRSGTSLAGPITYNSFFSGLGTTTPCGNNQNDGDGISFFDHLANRWVVTDFAFPAFPGSSFYECIGVSKSADPVSGGWWLYALQIDPTNPSYLGDYPKIALWNNAYYLTVNLFSSNTTFNGVRAFALDRNAMLTGGTMTSIAYTITPTTLGNAYSLLPATFRYGAPPAGTDEWLMAIDSSDNMTLNTAVYAWRFHADFTTPANSSFGTGASHSANGAITVSGFYDAIAKSGNSLTTDIVPQNGTQIKLDTLGDKLMYPLYYQNLDGVESIYASHTVSKTSNGGTTAIRWYQFSVTGGVIPAAPTQWQTFDNSDALWRWMPSISVDASGNTTIGYSVSSGSMYPAIRYAQRLTSDPVNTMGQGEAVLQSGAGSQTYNRGGRWGDYSSTSADPIDGCRMWHTNEYYTATSSASWSTRVGSFKWPLQNTASQTTPHTITFNGSICPEWTATTERLGTMGTVDYYSTWDSNNLYLAMSDSAAATNPGYTYVAVVDTDPTNQTSGNTGTAGALACAGGFNANGKGNFAMTHTGFSTFFYTGGSGSWPAWTPSATTNSLGSGYSNTEFRFKWSDLGLVPGTSPVGVYMFVCNGSSLVSAWPPENVQSGTGTLNAEVAFAANGTGQTPRTYARHINNETITLTNGAGPFSLLDGYVTLTNVSGLTGSCTFDALVSGNDDSTAAAAIRRTYTLTPGSGCTGLTTNLTLKYEDGTTADNAPSELKAYAEGSLDVLVWSPAESIWIDLGATSRDATGNTVTLNGVHNFSEWSLGQGNAPTAVSVSAFSVQSEHTLLATGLAGLGVLLLGMLAFAFTRKR